MRPADKHYGNRHGWRLRSRSLALGVLVLASLIERRQALHRCLQRATQENHALRDELLRLGPLANLGSAMCMIAHEINNILTPLLSYTQLALRQSEDHQLALRTIEKTTNATRQACRIMESIIDLAHGKQMKQQFVQVRKLVDEVFICLARDFEKDRISVNLDIQEDLKVYCVPVQIQQVLMNLILNARQAMLGSGGILTISAYSHPGSVTIEVRDTGPGIPRQLVDRVFDPFFSTKQRCTDDEPCGAGLGLAFCKLVVDAHGGTVSVESVHQKGTVFRIDLPAASKAEQA